MASGLLHLARERGGKLLNLYRMLLHSPPIAEGWLAFLTAVRQRGSLPGRYRELAILRVAVLNGASYEFDVHTPFALREGIAPAAVEALRAAGVRTPGVVRARSGAAYVEVPFGAGETRVVGVSEWVAGEVLAQHLALRPNEHDPLDHRVEDGLDLVRHYRPACIRSSRLVARRAASEHTTTMATSTSAPAHAWRCQSSYGEMA